MQESHVIPKEKRGKKDTANSIDLAKPALTREYLCIIEII